MQMHTPDSLLRIHGLDTPRPQKQRRPAIIRGVIACVRFVTERIERSRRVRAYDELLELSDELLDDIGLTADDIREARRRAKRGLPPEPWR